eukprot:gene18563-22163_t
MAFMSTTTSEEVALQYAESSGDCKPAFIFEVQMGMVDRGADISPFSQYPHEKEIVFAPLTGMEVVGLPRIKGRVIVMELRLSCNLNSQTIEQIIRKRKDAVLHLCADELQDVQHQVAKRQRTSRSITVQPLLDIMDEVVRKEETWFNQSQCFLHSIGQVLNVRDNVLSQLALSSGGPAFRAVAEGDTAVLRELVPAYTEELKNADGSTLLAFAVAQLGPMDAAACAEIVACIVSLPGFVLTRAGHDKDGKPPYLLAAELGLGAVVRTIISSCGSEQTIDVCSQEVPPAAARVLAAAMVACHVQIKNINGLPLDELRSVDRSAGYVLDLKERLARDRSNVGAWTLGLLLREDQSYLTMESIIFDSNAHRRCDNRISVDNVRVLVGLAEDYSKSRFKLDPSNQMVQQMVCFIAGAISGSASISAMDLSA